jgi:hypothetical protein
VANEWRKFTRWFHILILKDSFEEWVNYILSHSTAGVQCGCADFRVPIDKTPHIASLEPDCAESIQSIRLCHIYFDVSALTVANEVLTPLKRMRT